MTVLGEWLNGRLNRLQFAKALGTWLAVLVGFFVPFHLARYACSACNDYTQGHWFLFLLLGLLLSVLWLPFYFNIAAKRLRDSGVQNVGFWVFVVLLVLVGSAAAAGKGAALVVLVGFVSLSLILFMLPSAGGRGRI